MKSSVVLLAAALALMFAQAGASLAEEASPANGNHAPKIATQSWSFTPPFGAFDRAQLQRGFQVYRDICANCHSMKLMYYRNLGEPGGPEFSPKAVEVLASQAQVPDGPNEKGEMFQRPARPSDRFRAPFANDQLARNFNKGALPPDLSVIAKARHGGPAYIASLLSGYGNPPAGLAVPAGQYYNPYMAGDVSSAWSGDPHHVPKGGFIAMPPQLTPGKVTFDDGTPSTVPQQAKDVSAFLMWAAEPKLEDRKQMGFAVMIYLLLFTALLYWSYRRVWRGESH